MPKPVRSQLIQIRVTVQEKNRIEGLARLYAGGNISLWVVMQAMYAPRQMVTEVDRSDRPKRRGKK